jgi:type I restriction enzyme, S subunit
MTVPMPSRNTTAETVARAADKCLRLACSKHFPIARIGDIAEVVSGGTPSTDKSEYWGKGIVWLTPKDLGRPHNIEIESSERSITKLALESSSARLLPSGTVLLSSRAPIGHLGIAARPLTTNQGFKNIICGQRVDPRFLFHLLRGSIDELDALGRGNTFREIPASIVKQFVIPLPPRRIQEATSSFLDALYRRLSGARVELPELPEPIAGQRRIIAEIEDLAAQIDEARDLRLQTLRDADTLFEQARARLLDRLTAKGTVSLTDAALLQRGKFSHRPRNDPRFFGGPHPWIQIGEIEQSDKYIKSWHETLNDDGLRISKKFPKGTVLVSIAATIGSVGILTFDCCVPDSIVAVTPKSGFESEFLYHFLGYVRAHLASIAPQNAQKNINLQILASLQVPAIDAAEQQKIVEVLNALQTEVGDLKNVQAESAIEVGALLPSVLDRAFRGEL